MSDAHKAKRPAQTIGCSAYLGVLEGPRDLLAWDSVAELAWDSVVELAWDSVAELAWDLTWHHQLH